MATEGANLETGFFVESFKKPIESLQQNLLKFGLSYNQAKVYVFLSKNGPKSAAEIAKALKLPRTETYHLVNSLQNKGIVVSKFGKPIQFDALSLDKSILVLVNNERSRINELEEQKKELVTLWKTIPTAYSDELEMDESRFQILKGKNSLTVKFKNMIEKCDKEILILGTEEDLLKFYHTDFLDSLKKLKKSLKILTTCTSKTSYVFEKISKEKIKKFYDLPGEGMFFILKDHVEVVFLIKTGDELMAVWTDSKPFVESFSLLFNLVWNKSSHIEASDDLDSSQLEFNYEHRVKELDQEKIIIETLQNYADKFKKSSSK